MRKFLGAAGLAVAVGTGLPACYPERASQPNDYASITTIYDTLMAFDSVVTFYVPDSVVHIGGTDNISHFYDSLIIARTAGNMTAKGYTQVFDSTTAELTLHPVVTLSDDYDYTGLDWCAVWGWAYTWVCTGWIPDYPVDVVGYTYSTGTILIFMADLSDGVPPATSQPPVVWVAGINGVVSGGTSAALAEAIADGIDQAFSQSPYIYRVNP